MSKKQKLFEKILNNPQNLRFDEFCNLVEAFGFVLIRITGSHHIYYHPQANINVNIQPLKSQAKSYQVKQFLALVVTRGIKMEGE